ncbi:hypothetical protein CA833_22575 [Novosphingobium sp. KA1]|nr:hypothetical protein [Novosphingobium sp. KA1]QSR19936.1 hypothetical protein CA833_22575 [Novosphingobium sp. KA1]
MVIAALRLLHAGEIYASIDWSVIVLLAAMIPDGQSFKHSGAAAIAAQSHASWAAWRSTWANSLLAPQGS